MAEKRFQITVLLDQEEHSRFKAYCDERGFKKSTLVARLIRDHLDNEGLRATAVPLTEQQEVREENGGRTREDCREEQHRWAWTHGTRRRFSSPSTDSH